jgi:hypothetical protein
MSNEKSGLPCGCDPGCVLPPPNDHTTYKCEQHRLDVNPMPQMTPERMTQHIPKQHEVIRTEQGPCVRWAPLGLGGGVISPEALHGIPAAEHIHDGAQRPDYLGINRDEFPIGKLITADAHYDTRDIRNGPESSDVIGPTRASSFPHDAAGRKARPVASGVLDYFPDALVAIAHVSWLGNEQHNPGQPLHWARNKSSDEADALLRHFLQRGSLDDDGVPHSAKLAWRALALLQKEIEAAPRLKEGRQ